MRLAVLSIGLLLSAAPIMPVLAANPAAPSSAAGQAGAQALTEPDTTFLPEAIQGGMAEVKLGKLAAEKASSAEVKQFGQRMVQDHSAANQKLTALAEKHKLGQAGTKGTPPLESSMEAKATEQELTRLSGKDFDRAYMRHMVEDHEKTVAKFKAEAKDGKSAEVKQLAEQLLPTLEEHLRMARSLSEQVQAAR
jgi:putative membrane protein